MNAAWNFKTQDHIVNEKLCDKVCYILGGGSSGEPKPTGLPAPGERAVVRCPGFQCLAYRDSKGSWREARSQQRLPEVLAVVLRF